MNRRLERLQDLEARLTGFEPAAYDAAVALLAAPGRSAAETGSALARCELLAENGLREIEDARREFEAATGVAAEANPVRPLWAEIDGMEAELGRVEKAARQSEARALVAKEPCDTAEGEIAALRRPDGKVRWRDRGAYKEAQSRLDTSRPEYERLYAAAVEARRIANAFRRDTKAAIADLSASAALSRDEIKSRDTAATQAETRVRELEQAQFATLNQLTELRAMQAAAVAAEELITTCTQRGWPDMNVQAGALRVEITQDNARRRTVEQRHAELQEQYGKLARDAQGEIIRAARLVATTLARFRTVKAVLDGPYDVVLIDEVGAAGSTMAPPPSHTLFPMVIGLALPTSRGAAAAPLGEWE